MTNTVNQKIHKDIKHFKHKCLILKIKWIFFFVLPILVIVLAYQVSKQFLKIRMKELGNKVKENGIHHGPDKHPES